MFPSSERGFGGGVGVAVGDGLGLVDGDGDGEGVGVGDAVGEGLGDGDGDGQGVGAGTVRSLPLKLPGFVPLGGAVGTEEVAFELKAIQRPSALIIGRLLPIKMRTFAPVPEEQILKRTLRVSVI